MARKLYEKQAVRRRNGQLANGVALVVYTDAAGTVLADVSATVGGSAIAGSTVTTADIAGLGPASLRFYGPSDGTDILYMRTPDDASLGVQKIEADPDPRLDLLEAGVTSGLAAHEADTTAIHGIADTTKIVVRELLTQATVDAKQAAGDVLNLAAGTHTVASVITLRPVVRILGAGADQGGSKGTRIVGTTGQDVFKIDGAAAPYGGYELENLQFSGGDNQLVLTGDTATHVTLRNVVFGGPVECGVLIEEGAIEEWYLDHVVFQGGQYGFRKISGGDGDTTNNYIDKTTFKDCIWGGQTKSGFWADTPFSNVATFINPIFNLTAEHAFYWRGGPSGVTIINPNTEQCGTSGKKNRTTLTGTVSSGATSGTLASATGWATGDQITIAGAGASGADVEDTVTISGTTATWTTPTSTAVTGPKVTNAKWDEFHFTPIPGVSAPANVSFLGGIVASEATLGRLRYSVRVQGNYVTLLGMSGGTGNDIPAYVSSNRVVALGGNLLVRPLGGSDYATGTAGVSGAIVALPGTASNVPLTAKMAPSHSTHAFDVKNSADSVLAFIDQLGRLYLGAAQSISLDATNNKLTVDASSGSAGADRLDIWLAASETRRALRVLSNVGSELFTIGPDGSLNFGAPSTSAGVRSGTGTPESVVSAPVGTLFLRTDGGANTTLYIKQTGAGNTGWFAVTP